MVVSLRRGLAGFNWLGLGCVVGVLTVWQLVVSTHLINYSSLPGPIQIWSGLRYLAGSGGGLWSALGHTVHCVLLAWAIGVAIGGAAGLLLALNPTVASWGTATVDLFRSLPVVALIPVAILIWGTASKSEVILGAYAALWPMLINTAGGVRGVTPRLRDVARILGLSRWQTLRKIVLPSTAGAMLVGARLALATSLVICVVAEMLGLQSGVGNQLVLEQGAGQGARTWAYILVIGVLGLIANAGLTKAVRVAFPGVSAVSDRSAQ
jgi:ABC-type nitrate/sulfonate/bicarbonate transport system permease component